MPTTGERFRFDQIEGLRAYLALWVVFGHAWQLTQAPIGHLGMVLGVPSNAVTVFIILSGFVITHLLVGKEEAYGPYITRRFFRLWPLFMVCAVLGWVTAPLALDVANGVAWADGAYMTAFRESRELRMQTTQENPVGHILAHVTLLHGAVPFEILPQASRTILGPAWSISLEWQFYLIAPLVLAVLRRPGGYAIMVVAAFAIYALARKGAFGTHDAAFLPNSVVYFAIGICSRLALPKLRSLNADPMAVAAVAGLAVLLIASKPLGLLPWALVYPFLVWPRQDRAAAVVRLVLSNPVAATLGQASYSIYLVHYPLLLVAAWLALRLNPGISAWEMFAALIAATFGICVLSLALYRLVEKPGMAFGQKVAARLERKTPPKPQPAPATSR